MVAPQSTPVIVLSGFLGAGKSTLLNDLLRDPAFGDTAVIINEFGDISIDHDLVRVGEREMMITTTGCLCCTAGSDIRTSLFELHESVQKQLGRNFSRVIVETTGLADPAPVVNQLIPGGTPATGLRDHVVARRFHLAGFVCVVDVLAAEQTLERHFECLKQIAFADRIVLTKIDLAESPIEDLRRQIADINPTAEVVDRHGAGFAIAYLFEAREFATAQRKEDVEDWLALDRVLAAEQSGEHAATTKGRHAGRIQTFSIIRDEPVSQTDLDGFVFLLQRAAGDRLLRVKGLISVSDDVDRPILIHVVQHTVYPFHRLEQWPSEDRRTRIVLICRDIDPETVQQLFDVLAGLKRPRAAPVALVLIAAAFAIAVGAAVLSVSNHLSEHHRAGHRDCNPLYGPTDSVCTPTHLSEMNWQDRRPSLRNLPVFILSPSRMQALTATSIEATAIM
ncbi:CobW family GTP-binding protein [Bradyrhizobium sp. USDA 3364]